MIRETTNIILEKILDPEIERFQVEVFGTEMSGPAARREQQASSDNISQRKRQVTLELQQQLRQE